MNEVEAGDITIARKEVFGDCTSGVSGPTSEDYRIADIINRRIQGRTPVDPVPPAQPVTFATTTSSEGQLPQAAPSGAPDWLARALPSEARPQPADRHPFVDTPGTFIGSCCTTCRLERNHYRHTNPAFLPSGDIDRNPPVVRAEAAEPWNRVPSSAVIDAMHIKDEIAARNRQNEAEARPPQPAAEDDAELAAWEQWDANPAVKLADVVAALQRIADDDGEWSDGDGWRSGDPAFQRVRAIAVAALPAEAAGVRPPLDLQAQQAPSDAAPFVDTPLKQAVRRAFDNPTIANIEAVAAASASRLGADPRALNLQSVMNRFTDLLDRCQIYGPADRLRETAAALSKLITGLAAAQASQPSESKK